MRPTVASDSATNDHHEGGDSQGHRSTPLTVGRQAASDHGALRCPKTPDWVSGFAGILTGGRQRPHGGRQVRSGGLDGAQLATPPRSTGRHAAGGRHLQLLPARRHATPIDPAGTPLADAVEALSRAARAAALHFGSDCPWAVINVITAGSLLGPGASQAV